MITTKRKRKRKKRYITGTHISLKCNMPIKYRSGWEFEVVKYLDRDPNIISYVYEGIKIPYISNVRTGKVRTYYPDFLVLLKDGTQTLIEVKRKDKITQPKTAKKLKSGEEWCKINGIKWEIWHDDKIKIIKLLNEQMGLTHKTVKRPRKKKTVIKKDRSI